MPIIKSKIFTRSKKTNSFFAVILFILSFFLVFINKADLYIGSKIKTTSVDFASPIVYLFTLPFDKSISVIKNFNSLKNASIENDKLKEEIKILKKWQSLSLKLINENKAYKELLNVTDDTFEILETARVINKSPNIFANIIQLNIGSNKKITINSGVVNERGLIGRIINIGNVSSRVLLITDINSSIPVKTLNQDVHAIISGQSDSMLLKLKFIKENRMPKIGEIIVTSGNADMFPSNIAVGKVYKIENNICYVKPFVNFKELEFVNVISKKI